MLLKIHSDVLRLRSIVFTPGLNVILGDENATNSIGKSTLLMVIDFAFGGDTLISHNADLVDELGDHDYFFTFIFDDRLYRFRRGTSQPGVVYVCDAEYEPIRGISLGEYTATLKQAYNVTLEDLTSRALVGLYLRVWGKENLSVQRPLHVVQRQPTIECINTLIKTFGEYDSVRDLSRELEATEKERKALATATGHAIVPAIKSKEYASNQKRIIELEGEIADIRMNLAKYATNLSEIVNKEVLDLKVEKDGLLAVRLTVANKLKRILSNLKGSRHITSKSFRDLVKFFPEVDQERLASVEEFHNGVARVLRSELQQMKDRLEQQVTQIDEAITEIDAQMAETLSSIEQPGVLVDRVVNVTLSLQDAREANQIYEWQREVKSRVKEGAQKLAEEKARVLALIESSINDSIRLIVASVFGADRKSPRIALRDRSYSFDTYEDTGTGTAYSNLVIFDLTIFLLTQLPVVAHDSLLFKNIENNSVAKLLQVYLKTRKQSFIAIDEIYKYGRDAAELLNERSVIKLGNEAVLYIKDWRK